MAPFSRPPQCASNSSLVLSLVLNTDRWLFRRLLGEWPLRPREDVTAFVVRVGMAPGVFGKVFFWLVVTVCWVQRLGFRVQRVQSQSVSRNSQRFFPIAGDAWLPSLGSAAHFFYVQKHKSPP